MPTRYLVHDVPAVLPFYTELLGFAIEAQWGPAFAIVRRGETVVWLSGPDSSAAQPTPDGRRPEPGGWNRVVLEVEDLDGLIATLHSANVAFRNVPITGPGGTQVVIEDPSGNPIELFKPR